MAIELLDLILSMARITEEETDLLLDNAPRQQIDEVVRDKIRLASALDARLAKLERETPGWRETIDTDLRQSLADASQRLATSAKANATALERKIALAEDLIIAIEQDHRKRQGSSSSYYGAGGVMQRTDLPSPIAINTRL
ncbi:hypothetical protein KY084_05925 [Stakelama sp. CBK3Z-3]|uniref:Flagellar protein FlgN n=1 Tax=Stakelama flava TaxID=2860338 RepID=A0ABS6XJN5_9SPHN|nr:hypothetical protein [Stakelama flava]MBW4330410.1 hypothetical protein [Stakelama flava]